LAGKRLRVCKLTAIDRALEVAAERSLRAHERMFACSTNRGQPTGPPSFVARPQEPSGQRAVNAV